MTEAKRNKTVKPDPELLKLANALLTNYQKPEDLIGENGLLKQLTKMLVERAIGSLSCIDFNYPKSISAGFGTS